MPVRILSCLIAAWLQQTSLIHVAVTSAGTPVSGAQVIVSGRAERTTVDGKADVPVEPGSVELVVFKEGFAPVTVTAVAVAGGELSVEVQLVPQTIDEEVTVSSTRTQTRVEDQAMRVEVLGAEEIEEKQLMTPGDIVMMLNEMGGLRVQATSPSLGAASVRVQGMRGRYTRFLSDGLPLYGEDVGGLGLLQIPPTDLAQVEVIKGIASSLYGAGALGGVVNLISRRPGKAPVREALVNRTTRGGSDAVFFGAQPLGDGWSATLLAGGHWHERNDVDGDGWADLAGYSRGVLRPRIFWNDGGGRSLFATAGVTFEQRQGGTLPGRVLAATAAPFRESLDTTRIDTGLVAQTLIATRYVLTGRFSATRKRAAHDVGEVREHQTQQTIFGELAIRGTAPRQTWVVGAAVERATLDPREQPAFAYIYTVPGLFAQDDVEVGKRLTVSASARVDAHSEYGTFFSPRASALVRGAGWIGRLSVGSGFFAPSALTEETEAAGLTRLRVPAPLKAERGRSASIDLTRNAGPVAVTGTWFRYDVRTPAVVDRATYTLASLAEPTTNTGVEGVATFRQPPFSVTATYTYVLSREGVGASRGDVPLTPAHGAGLVGMWEREGRNRLGLEAYFTGRQRLEDNPYRSISAAYVLFGALVEHKIGRVRLFVNGENLGGVRQALWQPSLRSSRASDGRWAADAWAPLDGRVVNGGVKLQF